MNYTQPYGYQQYPQQAYQQSMFQQPMYQPFQQNRTMDFNKPVGLQGRLVDSIDTMRSIEIPLDGSISYYPLTDGSMIATKQLMQDGTSKIIIYKPYVDKEDNTDKVKYVTEDELKKVAKENTEYFEEIKNLKKKIKKLKKTC